MRIGCIIQARTSSTRLPNKVLLSLPYASNVTVLEQVLRRVKKSSHINHVIIATTLDGEDDAIVSVAEKENAHVFRGSKENVLERYYLAASEYKLDLVIRITSDCPCIDPSIVDEMISAHIKAGADYTTNALDRTFPHGQDIEVFSFTTLETAYKNANESYEKEHVTMYIYKSRPDLFKIQKISAGDKHYGPDIRITLDTIEDYTLLSAVYDYLYEANKFFNCEQLIALFNNKPWLKFINQKIIQKKVFDTVEEEVKEAVKVLELQSLDKAAKILKNKIY